MVPMDDDPPHKRDTNLDRDSGLDQDSNLDRDSSLDNDAILQPDTIDEALEKPEAREADSKKVVSLARATVSKKTLFGRKTPKDHQDQADKLSQMRKRLLRAKEAKPEIRKGKPSASVEERIKTPLPERPMIETSQLMKTLAGNAIRLVMLLLYVMLIFSIYRMLLAYQPADHFIYAPADVLASIRFLGVSVPRIVIEYNTLQIATPVILIVLQIVSPFITLGSIPTYRHPLWLNLRPQIRFRERSLINKVVSILLIWPCFIVFSVAKWIWHFFMVVFFVLPAPLLLLTALEFLPNATIETSQLTDVAGYALLTAMILGLFVMIRSRSVSQIMVTLPLFIVMAFPFVPIWHLTKGPLARDDIDPILLSLEVGLCRVMTAGGPVITNDNNQPLDPCYPETGFSPAGDYLFAYPLAAEQGLPLSYFEAFTLNDDLVYTVATQTDLPLSYFTVGRNFYQIRHEILDLSNVDFRGSSFVIRDFRGADLAGVRFGCPSEFVDGLNFNLSGCTALDGADFSGANLKGASFERLSLRNAQFVNTKATDSKLSQVNMNGANLDRVNLDKAIFYWVSMVEAGLEDASLNNATLDKVDLTDSVMHRVQGKSMTLNNVTFSGADLGQSNLSGASMNNVNLDAALLIDANLSGAYIGDSSFVETLMTGTNLDQTVIKNNN